MYWRAVRSRTRPTRSLGSGGAPCSGWGTLHLSSCRHLLGPRSRGWRICWCCPCVPSIPGLQVVEKLFHRDELGHLFCRPSDSLAFKPFQPIQLKARAMPLEGSSVGDPFGQVLDVLGVACVALTFWLPEDPAGEELPLPLPLNWADRRIVSASRPPITALEWLAILSSRARCWFELSTHLTLQFSALSLNSSDLCLLLVV